MFYGSQRSRIVHYQQCGYVERSLSRDCCRMRQFYTLDEARQDGYRICKCCDPVAKRFKSEQKSIDRFCNSNNIYCNITNGEMRIVTRSSNWKVGIGKGGKLVLYHQNKCGDRENRRKYHIQDYNVGTAMGVLKYIVRHDRYREEIPEIRTVEKPNRGCRNYNTKKRKAKEFQKRRDIKYVLDLIDAMASV